MSVPVALSAEPELPAGAVPEALRRLLAVAAGEDRHGAGCLRAGTTAWFASPTQSRRAAAQCVRGRERTIGMAYRLGQVLLSVRGAVSDGVDSWAEVIRHVPGAAETSIVGVRRDGRLVWLRVPYVPVNRTPAVPPRSGPDRVPDARLRFEQYFEDLCRARFDAAAGHFSADVIYSHPPYRTGGERVLVRGSEALARGFAVERGPRPVRLRITGFWQGGRDVFIEGVAEGIARGGSFVSMAQVDADGAIARYVAFYNAVRLAPVIY